MKASYTEMIEDAILTLKDRSGSSRQAIWKCLHAKYPEADYKQFLVRLKKVKGSDQIVVDGNNFKLSREYREKLVKALL